MALFMACSSFSCFSYSFFSLQNFHVMLKNIHKHTYFFSCVLISIWIHTINEIVYYFACRECNVRKSESETEMLKIQKKTTTTTKMYHIYLYAYDCISKIIISFPLPSRFSRSLVCSSLHFFDDIFPSYFVPSSQQTE